jgi:hypothetical protein
MYMLLVCTVQLKDMVLKLSGTHRQHGSQHRRGGSPPPRGRATSLYRSGYYRPGVVQDDMAVPPATYLGGSAGVTGASSASSTPAWDLPGRAADGEAREWVAQVEPGVQITFVSLPGGAGNDLKRIRFRFVALLVDVDDDHLTGLITDGLYAIDRSAMHIAARCTTSGRRRSGGATTTSASWSSTTSGASADRCSPRRRAPTTARSVAAGACVHACMSLSFPCPMM